MKKVILGALVASAVAGVASADLAVNWFNSTKGIYDVGGSGGSGPFIDGSVVQLVWSSAGIATSAGGEFAVDSSAVRGENAGLSGEYVLDTTLTGGFGFFTGQSLVYTSADVGGADINTGYFFTRIFQDTGADGEYFLDVDAIDTSLWVYDDGSSSGGSPDPSTVFSDNALSNTVWIDANASTVVPEPATIGLMGIAGLGLFLARRKARR